MEQLQSNGQDGCQNNNREQEEDIDSERQTTTDEPKWCDINRGRPRVSGLRDIDEREESEESENAMENNNAFLTVIILTADYIKLMVN